LARWFGRDPTQAGTSLVALRLFLAAERGILHGGLGATPDESYAADEVAVVAPRQNGKTALAAARIARCRES
jgi:hypothetical protein